MERASTPPPVQRTLSNFDALERGMKKVAPFASNFGSVCIIIALILLMTKTDGSSTTTLSRLTRSSDLAKEKPVVVSLERLLSERVAAKILIYLRKEMKDKELTYVMHLAAENFCNMTGSREGEGKGGEKEGETEEVAFQPTSNTSGIY